MSTAADIGAFPMSGEEARRQKKLLRIGREDMLHVVKGERNPVLLSFFVSNDFCHMGKIVLPTGEGSRYSEPMRHAGDMVAYVERGPLVFVVPALNETFVVDTGDAMFLPEGTEYQMVNYESHAVEAIFMVAPKL
jgi:hypothetical protein